MSTEWATNSATAEITSGQTGLAPLVVSVPEALTMRRKPWRVKTSALLPFVLRIFVLSIDFSYAYFYPAACGVTAAYLIP
jgi:hypothetical protein